FENEAASWGMPTLDHQTAVQNAIKGWIDDGTPEQQHRKNMLSDATLTGIGAAFAIKDGKQYIFIVQDFGGPCPGETGQTPPKPGQQCPDGTTGTFPNCVPIPVPAQNPPNLIIQKEPGPCVNGPGDTVQCQFTITVINTGQGDFNGSL